MSFCNILFYPLTDKRHLRLDMLSVHLIRNITGSTIISYHPKMKFPTTTAVFFHQHIQLAGGLIATNAIINTDDQFSLSTGHSVYWQNIFQKSSNPTFVLLIFIWHAIYAWGEALERLYEHICHLVWFSTLHLVMPLENEFNQETHIMNSESVTLEAHVIHAYHLYYLSLLDDLAKHIAFVRDTKNPMESHQGNR